MKVTLIDYTGIHSDDRMYAARLLVYAKNTRLVADDIRAQIALMTNVQLLDQLEAVANTIRSSWEFVDFTFDVKNVSRACTQQMQRTRVGISFAEQSFRVVNKVGGFDVKRPEKILGGTIAEISWSQSVAQARDTYLNLITQSVPFEDARGILPMNTLTNILVKLNLRTLADLLAKRKSLRVQGEYRDVMIAMEKEVLRVMPWTNIFLNPERTSTPNLDIILKEMLGDRQPTDAPVIMNALKELEILKGTWG